MPANRPRRALPSPTLAAACLLALTGCSSAPPAHMPESRPLIAPTASPAGWNGSADLRVLSFNLRRPFLLDGPNHWGLRRDEVAAFLHAQNADVIGTQECVDGQAKYLLAALPQYAMIGAGRDDGERAGEMCAVFYRRDRFDLVQQGHFWLSDTPIEPGSKSWGAVWTRMVTWARLRDRVAGQNVHVFNTHFSVASAQARQESARLLRRAIADLAPDGPVIVTGDFNEGADEPAYTQLTRDEPRAAGLNDTYRAIHRFSGDEPGTRHGFSGDTGGDRIDWVLVSDHFATQASAVHTERVDGRVISDHHPVSAVLRYRTPGALVRATRPEPRTN